MRDTTRRGFKKDFEDFVSELGLLGITGLPTKNDIPFMSPKYGKSQEEDVSWWLHYAGVRPGAGDYPVRFRIVVERLWGEPERSVAGRRSRVAAHQSVCEHEGQRRAFRSRVQPHLYGIRFIALRFFTVYGPRQRPDLAIHKFARLMLRGEPIPIYGDGSTQRDYSYVDDVVEGVRRAMSYTGSPYEIVNLGNNQTVGLLEMVRILERALGKEARLQFLPPQPGDVPRTWASLDKAQKVLDFRPHTPFEEGVERFVGWLLTYAAKA